jgi:hypothetical protein
MDNMRAKWEADCKFVEKLNPDELQFIEPGWKPTEERPLEDMSAREHLEHGFKLFETFISKRDLN